MIAAALVVIFDPVVTSYSRGHGKWFAQFYDAATVSFYAGTGDTAWSAIAWAFDEYMSRGVLKVHRIAVNPEEKPGDFHRIASQLAAVNHASPLYVAASIAEMERVLGARDHMADAAIYARQVMATPVPLDPEPVKAPRVGCFALKLDEAKAANEPKKRKAVKRG